VIDCYSHAVRTSVARCPGEKPSTKNTFRPFVLARRWHKPAFGERSRPRLKPPPTMQTGFCAGR
jgi:hypothetical protein